MRIADNARGVLSEYYRVRLAHIVNGVESMKIVVKGNIKDRSLSMQRSVNVAFALGVRFPIASLKSIVCFQDKRDKRVDSPRPVLSPVRYRSRRMLLCRMYKVQLRHCGSKTRWPIHLSVNHELCANHHLLLHLFIVVCCTY